MRSRRHRFRPDCVQLERRCLLSGYAPISSSGYTPAQLTSAYGLNAITFTSSSGAPVKGDGTGETIALIEMYSDPNLQSDLETFDAQYGLPVPALTVVNQAGSQTDGSWAIEQSLDVEWAHAIAPGANLLVVEAAPAGSQTQELQNLLSAVERGAEHGGRRGRLDELGVQRDAQRVVVSTQISPRRRDIQASRSSPRAEMTGPSNIHRHPQKSSPSAGPRLNLSGAGTYGSESGWVDSGGGYSQYEPEPSYQESVQQTGMRSTPDVAFDADPNTGVEVYSTPPGSSQGSWQEVGGTSLGAPAWAGIIAIVDQGRAFAGVIEPGRPHSDLALALRGRIGRL